jgi:hypothetical protein
MSHLIYINKQICKNGLKPDQNSIKGQQLLLQKTQILNKIIERDSIN